MFFNREKVLTTGQLKRLSEHKYSSEGRSLLDALFQPWWNFLVSRTPLWLAPNLITVIGLITNVVTSLLLVYYSPDAKSEAPWWVFILCALGLFIYQSLDAIDGKQARRTNTSSPLGELFDHGCDSVSTVFVALSACIAVGLGEYPSWMFFQCFAAVTLFYCAHWQAYVSGTLKFGRIDVTEAQLTIIGIHLISATFGTGFWATKMHPIDILECRHSIILMTIGGGSMALYELFMLLCRGGVGKNGSTVAIPMVGASLRECMTTVFASAYLRTFVEFCPVLWVGGAGKNGSTIAILNLEFKQWEVIFGSLIGIYLLQRTLSVILTGGVGKNGSSVAGTSVLSPVIPLSLVVMPAYIIYRKSTNRIYENNPVLYILSFGLVGAKVTNRLVVAHMTRNEMDYLDSSLVGPTMLFLNQYFNFFIDEYYVLWLSMLWVTFDLIKYCSQVCVEICDHMHIQLFKISPSVIPQTSANKNVIPEDVLDLTLSMEDDSAPLLEQDDDDVVLYNGSSESVI